MIVYVLELLKFVLQFYILYYIGFVHLSQPDRFLLITMLMLNVDALVFVRKLH